MAGRCTEYDGESGSNGYSRGKEQAGGLRLEEEDNALWKHCRMEHNSEKVEFSMKVLGSFQTAMARQVNEGVRIKRSKADCLMNSHSCYREKSIFPSYMANLNLTLFSLTNLIIDAYSD